MLARRSTSFASRGSCSSSIVLHRHLHLPRPSFSQARAALFGLSLPSLPVPTNEPLAGTGEGSAPFSWLFLLEVGLGLPLALWAYKCIMMIAFQRKIIYLPSVPPGSRNESLAEGERTPPLDGLLSGMDWKEVTISSTAPSRWLRRPVALKGIELEWREQGAPRGTRVDEQERLKEKHTVILYLQGNAGTPLLRLPLFRRLLQPSPTSSPPSPSSRSFNTLPSSTSNPPPLPSRLTLLAVAPRSFWLSTRSAPTQSTILADYRSTLKHLSTAYPDAQIILYGHSLGGAATLLLLSEGASKLRALEKVVGAIIENPLPSIPYMVRALYPQRWLPYHWLGPAVCDRWDAKGALARCGGDGEGMLGRVPALWIRSGADEIIPTDSEVKGEEGDGVERMWEDWTRVEERREGKAESRWVKIDGALHDTAFLDRKWREEVLGFLREAAR